MRVLWKGEGPAGIAGNLCLSPSLLSWSMDRSGSWGKNTHACFSSRWCCYLTFEIHSAGWVSGRRTGATAVLSSACEYICGFTFPIKTWMNHYVTLELPVRRTIHGYNKHERDIWPKSCALLVRIFSLQFIKVGLWINTIWQYQFYKEIYHYNLCGRNYIKRKYNI